jgi:hypothetical protein
MARALFLLKYILTNLSLERILVVKSVDRRPFDNQDMDGMVLKWNIKI